MQEKCEFSVICFSNNIISMRFKGATSRAAPPIGTLPHRDCQHLKPNTSGPREGAGGHPCILLLTVIRLPLKLICMFSFRQKVSASRLGLQMVLLQRGSGICICFRGVQPWWNTVLETEASLGFDIWLKLFPMPDAVLACFSLGISILF